MSHKVTLMMYYLRFKIVFLLCFVCLQYSVIGFAKLRSSIPYQAGQVMMVGFEGTSVDDQSPIVQQIKKYHIGGVIIADHYVNYHNTGKPKTRNIISPDQLKKLISQLQYYAKKYHVYPLLIAVNQEGGQITTLKSNKEFHLKLNDSQQTLGDHHRKLIFRQAYLTGKFLHQYGININFAPVAALNSNPDNPAIGLLGRTFGRDPHQVSRAIIATMKGYQAAGIACTLKHFPGMGSAIANTDYTGIVDVSSTWSLDELRPYQKAIASDAVCPLVMVSHIINTRLDPQGLPASLSYAIITRLLKEKLHYTGVVISDAIDVDAINQNFSLTEAASLSIFAGSNIILYDGGHREYPNMDIQSIYKMLCLLAKNNPNFRDSLLHSYKKVQQLKHIFFQRLEK